MVEAIMSGDSAMTTSPVPSVSDELLEEIASDFSRNGPCRHHTWEYLGAGDYVACADCNATVPTDFLPTSKKIADNHDSLAKSLASAFTELRQLRAENADLRKDAERLDWLDQRREAYGFEDIHEGNRWVIDGSFATLRIGIDAAMVGEAK